MNEITLKLIELDGKGIKVFSKADLAAMLSREIQSKLSGILRRLVADGILERVARGVYVNRLARSNKSYLIEEIACVLRRGHFNYVSLESILTEFGVISQIMLSRITVMTSGARGLFNTPYGTIEFTHTDRSLTDLHMRTIHMEGRPLLIATKNSGIADLRRVGRNTNMLDPDEI